MIRNKDRRHAGDQKVPIRVRSLVSVRPSKVDLRRAQKPVSMLNRCWPPIVNHGGVGVEKASEGLCLLAAIADFGWFKYSVKDWRTMVRSPATQVCSQRRMKLAEWKL